MVRSGGYRLIDMVLPERQKYTLDELFQYLPISMSKLGEISGLSKKTLERAAYKKAVARRSTLNRLLTAFSEVYGRPFTWDNVTGIAQEQESEDDTAVGRDG